MGNVLGSRGTTAKNKSAGKNNPGKTVSLLDVDHELDSYEKLYGVPKFVQNKRQISKTRLLRRTKSSDIEEIRGRTPGFRHQDQSKSHHSIHSQLDLSDQSHHSKGRKHSHHESRSEHSIYIPRSRTNPINQSKISREPLKSSDPCTNSADRSESSTTIPTTAQDYIKNIVQKFDKPGGHVLSQDEKSRLRTAILREQTRKPESSRRTASICGSEKGDNSDAVQKLPNAFNWTLKEASKNPSRALLAIDQPKPGSHQRNIKVLMAQVKKNNSQKSLDEQRRKNQQDIENGNPPLFRRKAADGKQKAKKDCFARVIEPYNARLHLNAPPVYISSTSGCPTKCRGNNPVDRLKNLDIVEELTYYPQGGGECGDGEAYDYYNVCNDCGCMELVKDGHDGAPSNKPVTYSRKQRFSFKNPGDDNEGPPFKWPYKIAPGTYRTSSFDEIPVGKNPYIEYDKNSKEAKMSNRSFGSKEELPVGKNSKGSSGSNSNDAEDLDRTPVTKISSRSHGSNLSQTDMTSRLCESSTNQADITNTTTTSSDSIHKSSNHTQDCQGCPDRLNDILPSSSGIYDYDAVTHEFRRRISVEQRQQPLPFQQQYAPSPYNQQQGPAPFIQRKGPLAYEQENEPSPYNQQQGPASFIQRKGPTLVEQRQGRPSAPQSESLGPEESESIFPPPPSNCKDQPALVEQRQGRPPFSESEGLEPGESGPPLPPPPPNFRSYRPGESGSVFLPPPSRREYRDNLSTRIIIEEPVPTARNFTNQFCPSSAPMPVITPCCPMGPMFGNPFPYDMSKKSKKRSKGKSRKKSKEKAKRKKKKSKRRRSSSSSSSSTTSSSPTPTIMSLLNKARTSSTFHTKTSTTRTPSTFMNTRQSDPRITGSSSKRDILTRHDGSLMSYPISTNLADECYRLAEEILLSKLRQQMKESGQTELPTKLDCQGMKETKSKSKNELFQEEKLETIRSRGSEHEEGSITSEPCPDYVITDIYNAPELFKSTSGELGQEAKKVQSLTNETPCEENTRRSKTFVPYELPSPDLGSSEPNSPNPSSTSTHLGAIKTKVESKEGLKQRILPMKTSSPSVTPQKEMSASSIQSETNSTSSIPRQGTGSSTQSGGKSASSVSSRNATASSVHSEAKSTASAATRQGTVSSIQSETKSISSAQTRKGTASSIQSEPKEGSNAPTRKGTASSIQSEPKEGSNAPTRKGTASSIQSGPNEGSNGPTRKGSASNIETKTNSVSKIPSRIATTTSLESETQEKPASSTRIKTESGSSLKGNKISKSVEPSEPKNESNVTNNVTPFHSNIYTIGTNNTSSSSNDLKIIGENEPVSLPTLAPRTRHRTLDDPDPDDEEDEDLFRSYVSDIPFTEIKYFKPNK